MSYVKFVHVKDEFKGKVIHTTREQDFNIVFEEFANFALACGYSKDTVIETIENYLDKDCRNVTVRIK